MESRAKSPPIGDGRDGQPGHLAGQLVAVSSVARGVVPSCVGLSITCVVGGQPFTVAATGQDLAAVDAVQYLDGGPCVTAIADEADIRVDEVDEDGRWVLFGLASSRAGIRASLSLPLRGAYNIVAGALNLYASQPAAFAGREVVLAQQLSASVSDLVRNAADLSGRIRDFAYHPPQPVPDEQPVEAAVAVLMGACDWSAEQARGRLASAANRAAVSVTQVAEALVGPASA